MKYRNKKITYDDQTFDSKKEFKRWLELTILQDKGIIKDLKRQVKYRLIPSQKGENGKVIEREVNYIADFVYFDNEANREVVEDTKGFKTKDYIIKRKLMLYFYGVRINEV